MRGTRQSPGCKAGKAGCIRAGNWRSEAPAEEASPAPMGVYAPEIGRSEAYADSVCGILTWQENVQRFYFEVNTR